MKKQFLSLIVAGLMLGRASQIKAMHEITDIRTTLCYLPTIPPMFLESSVNPETQKFTRLTFSCCDLERYENGFLKAVIKNGRIKLSLGVGSLQHPPSELNPLPHQEFYVPRPELNDGETPTQYKERLMNMGISLLMKNAHLLPDVKKFTCI